MRAATVRDRAATSICAVDDVLRAAVEPVAGAVTPVDSFRPSFLRAVLSLVLSASPEPSVDFKVVTDAASLARILVLTTTLELRRRAETTDTITTLSGTVPAAAATAFLNEVLTAAVLNCSTVYGMVTSTSTKCLVSMGAFARGAGVGVTVGAGVFAVAACSPGFFTDPHTSFVPASPIPFSVA